MFRFTSSVALRGGRSAADRYCCVWGALTVFQPHGVSPRSRVCAVPVYTAQVPGCSIWSGPCIVCGYSFWVLHKSADWLGPAVCAFPGQSISGSQEVAAHTLPGCGVPSPLCGPSLSFHAHQSGACSLCLLAGAGL